MTPIASKNLGIDETTGLNQRVVVHQFTADSDIEVVSVSYRIETLSPTGIVVQKSEPKTYTRYNAPAVLDGEGNEVTPAKMKFNELRESSLGIGIMGLVQSTIDANYPNLEQD